LLIENRTKIVEAQRAKCEEKNSLLPSIPLERGLQSSKLPTESAKENEREQLEKYRKS